MQRCVASSLRIAAANWPDATAVIIGAQRLTYAQLWRQARNYASALARCGIEAGQHVGILMPNCLEYILLFYGCNLLGACPVHINSRYKREDLRYVLGHSDIRLLFTSARQREYHDFHAMLCDVYPELVDWRHGQSLQISAAPLIRSVYEFHASDTCQWGREADFLAAGDARIDADFRGPRPDDIALIMYTSGTTANPKACLLSNSALEQVGHALAERWRMTRADRFWDPLPFFHMSTMLPLAACRAVGASFIASEHFAAGPALREIMGERATILYPSFPAISNALFEHPEFDPSRLDDVRIVNNVGPPELLRRYAQALPGAIHVSAYGLTEAGGVISFGSPDDSEEQLRETGGRPFAGIDVRIADPVTLQSVPAGATGEIWIRGPTLFSGYYKDPAKTAEVMTQDGYLRSGDLGSLDTTGHIRYLGRIKDMLKVGGENVAALEIESFLSTHPAIKLAQVIGVPDSRLQEVPAAFLELREGARMTATDVVQFCQGRIASYKIPRYVQFVSEWPMSSTKVQKFRLRDQWDTSARVDLT